MWDTIQMIIYIFAGVMFILSFWSDESRDRARRFIVAVFREVWIAISPALYKLVTGDVPPSIRKRGRVDIGGVPHRMVELQEPQHNEQNIDLHGGEEPQSAVEMEPITADELRRLAVALRHNYTTADKTKSGAIKAGWGIARSGSDPRYLRASQLYDLATAPEEPIYPNLEASRQPGTRDAKKRPRKAREVETL
jgi:hypothetical protein